MNNNLTRKWEKFAGLAKNTRPPGVLYGCTIWDQITHAGACPFSTVSFILKLNPLTLDKFKKVW